MGYHALGTGLSAGTEVQNRRPLSLGRPAHVGMEHQIDVHHLADWRRVVQIQLNREVLVWIDGDWDWELVHWHVLSTTTCRRVRRVGSRRRDRVHLRNRDRRKEDDVLVNDAELQIRTTTDDLTIT